MQKVKLKVKGMLCNNCENRIKKVLENMEGIENVEANHESGMVTVTSNEKIAVSKIVEKIENIGYEIIEE